MLFDVDRYCDVEDRGMLLMVVCVGVAKLKLDDVWSDGTVAVE
jgi:hypothetical protein